MMLTAIRRFLEQRLVEETDSDPGHRLRLATAALLIEMTRQDEHVDQVELDVVIQALQTQFGLSDEESGHLLELGKTEASEAVDYHQFTSLINNAYGELEKVGIIEHLWRVAFADGELNCYEEHMVRKIAGLLHVTHSDFIAAKLRVLAEAES